MTYLTTSEFSSLTGILSSDAILQEALAFAENRIIKKLFRTEEFASNFSTTRHQLTDIRHGFLTPNIMSIDGDLVVTTTDLRIFLVDNQAVTRTQIGTSAIDLNLFGNILTFDVSLPTNANETLVVEYKSGQFRFDDIIPEIKTLEKLEATNYIFINKPAGRLQNGLSNWTINGVSKTFGLGEMQSVIDQNNKAIRETYNDLRFKNIEGTRVGLVRRSRQDDHLYYRALRRRV